MLVFGVNKLKDIEADMVIRIGGIKVNYIFHPLRWNDGKDRFHILAVRVHQADAVAVTDILGNHIKHQYRFTGTRLTEQINMLAPGFALNAKKIIFIPIGSEA